MLRTFIASLIVLLNTVLAAQNSALNWAKGAVWYQIFLERFSNGDKSNDPTLADKCPNSR